MKKQPAQLKPSPTKSKKQLQAEKLEKIREAARAKGERMATRAIAQHQGYLEGIAAAQKNAAKPKPKSAKKPRAKRSR